MTNYLLLISLRKIKEAFDKGSPELAKAILVDFITNVEDEEAIPELIKAVINDNIALVRAIVSDKTTNINTEDNKGRTPLFWAVYDNNCKMVELLLSEGANPNICTYEGIMPLRSAMDNGYDDIEELLREYDARYDNEDMI